MLPKRWLSGHGAGYPTSLTEPVNCAALRVDRSCARRPFGKKCHRGATGDLSRHARELAPLARIRRAGVGPDSRSTSEVCVRAQVAGDAARAQARMEHIR